MNDCRVEEEALLPADNKFTHEDSRASPVYKWGIIILKYTLCAIGTAGPLLDRLYFQHGGSRYWMWWSWLPSVGFLVILTAIIYICNRNTLASAKTLAFAAKLMSFSLAIHFLFATVGMLINKDFQAIPKEASNFGLGPTIYYVILVSKALVFPIFILGIFGFASCTSPLLSLFTGIFVVMMVPAMEFAAMLAFHEKFTIEKVKSLGLSLAMSLAFCLAIFAAYFYIAYRKRISRSEHQKKPIDSTASEELSINL